MPQYTAITQRPHCNHAFIKCITPSCSQSMQHKINEQFHNTAITQRPHCNHAFIKCITPSCSQSMRHKINEQFRNTANTQRPHYNNACNTTTVFAVMLMRTKRVNSPVRFPVNNHMYQHWLGMLFKLQ